MPRVYNKHHNDAPKDAVYVGRPSSWGNPFSHLDSRDTSIIPLASRDEAVQAYEAWLLSQPAVMSLARAELRGKDLVCWCAPHKCHADILLRIANEEEIRMAQGFVTKIDARNTKFGTYYDVYVDNKNLGGGKFPPKGISEGDFVEYEMEKNARGYEQIKAGTLRKTDAPAGVKAPAAPAPSAISMDKQDVISRQAALNSALSFLSTLVAAGAIPEGKTLTPAKKADKLEAILMNYTAKFFNLSTGAVYDLPEEDIAEAAANWDEQE